MTNINNNMPLLETEALCKSFNANEGYVVDGISLSLKKGHVMALVGESGSGKTTLVRLIAGLETPDSGSISIAQKSITSKATFVQPEARKIGMVFQDYALFPHLTVYQNIIYGCKNVEKKQLKELFELVGLTGSENRYPHQLSGGQQQRVALARALAPRPELLILDEPFSNLDIALKQQLRNEIFEIIQQLDITAIFVTHDTQDAIIIANDIVVLKNGKMVQQGSAASLYKAPISLYVAALFGTVIPLNNKDLSYFNYIVSDKEKYAIRIEEFKVNTPSTYNLKVTLERSVFYGQQYLNAVKLPNGKLVSFTSAKQLQGEINLGFEQNAVLVFKEA